MADPIDRSVLARRIEIALRELDHLRVLAQREADDSAAHSNERRQATGAARAYVHALRLVRVALWGYDPDEYAFRHGL